ncbi:MAG: pantetheine-phosphate adenylyltransferase [Clostridia bacterium]|nr:pantetheine-phosphate adenylyltransferase [Clostridia bacterium]
MKTCVFAGTFDPITVGHKAVIDKIINSGRRVIITVGENPEKVPFFTEDERTLMLRAAFKGNKKVRVVKYSDLKDGYAEFLNSSCVTEYYRGIRNSADYEFERAREEKNTQLYPGVKTVYVFLSKYAFVSSSVVRERLSKGKDVKKYIPKKAYKTFRSILDEKKRGKN